ncbi:hypothetical protein K493DRAFT_315860 [Basidiobolus meristosporus CBS 931.73]|uniref:Ankyrin repeat domain-containing protein n=1 Tax=Basidiobolus meristosporus CBS 931.73 TaxID=1314790 RepID=A0A1Y1VQ02_9FUNG|nr:hypothetical protein K493DRAFT_322144 [Basidiobolus meristosporus CBS 931.73]ORX93714.1 hypothetical protein K493DRAFT_315860 [Basidiobolus meristosporus CBS 931.73]|eukprot:ORX62513.1 hypothetical protein K493DRAFT_322144 [Basidiobolus meristosporus CBS 931.73]
MHLNYPLHRLVFQNDFAGLETALGGSLYNQINERDHHGNTPLQLSLLLEHLEVAHLLLDRGADCIGRKRDHNGVPTWSPLEDATALQNRDLIRKILLKSVEQQARDWCASPISLLTAKAHQPSANENPVSTNSPPEGGPLAKLNQRLGETLDITLHWKFTSRLSNLLARHTLPRDAIRVRKKGCYFRVDFGEPTLLLGGRVQSPDQTAADVIQKRRQALKKSNQSRFSLIVRADDPNSAQAFPLPPTVIIVDHERELTQEVYPSLTGPLIDNFVGNTMRSPMVKWWLPLQNVTIKPCEPRKKLSLLKKKTGHKIYKIKNVSISILARELVDNMWTSPNGRTVSVSSSVLINKLRSLGFNGLDTLLSQEKTDVADGPKNGTQGSMDSDSEVDSDSEDDLDSNGKSSGTGPKFLKRQDRSDTASKRQSLAWDEVSIEQFGNVYRSEQDAIPVVVAEDLDHYFNENNTGAITFSKAKVSTQLFKFECKQSIKVCWAQPRGLDKSDGFPISLSQISPVLEQLLGGGILDWSGFVRLCNIAHKDGETPAGFPVKIDFPLHPVLGVRISTKECEVGSDISEDIFWLKEYTPGIILK